MANTIRLFICDDHTLFREGTKKLLELESDITVVGEASNGLELLDKVKKASPDVILLDLGMPQMDGVTATYKIKKICPHAKIIILTVYEDEPHIFNAIKAGAMGYLLKDVSIEELVEAIHRVYRGGALIQPSVATKVLKEFSSQDTKKIKAEDVSYGLTEREKDVLRLISTGFTNKDIAKKLGISVKTVKNHISNIFATLHVNNRTQAALRFLDKKTGI